MTKIPFTLEAWLKDKSQKVETRDGRPVKIISFEMTDTNDCPIAAQFRLCAGTPVVYLFDKAGHYKGEGDSNYDLFIITPEPELSEFEQKVRVCVTKNLTTHIKDENGEMSSTVFIDDDTAKKMATELLAIAEREIVNRVAKECYKDDFCIEDTVKFNEGYKLGKEVALKDLPRWKKATEKERFNERMIVLVGNNNLLCTNYAEDGEYYIPFSSLEKLPKED